MLFQSTRPVRGATQAAAGRDSQGQISIHAPRAGRDLRCHRQGGRPFHFNPRAPCGARPPPEQSQPLAETFQSTRPVRGATPSGDQPGNNHHDFNQRAPCGARQTFLFDKFATYLFQSTRPVRGATKWWAIVCTAAIFQSMRPVRGATSNVQTVGRIDIISIHAPRAGRDTKTFPNRPRIFYFNPRAPCGARRTGKIVVPNPRYFNPRAPCGARLSYFLAQAGLSKIFQSTRPVRGATAKVYKITLHTFATKGNS